MNSLTRAAIVGVLAGTTWACPGDANAASIHLTHAFKTPNLSAGFTPQAMTETPSGKLLLAEYKAGANTRLVDVTTSGEIYGQMSIAETHAGGMAIVGQWLFVQNAATTGHDTVRAYRLSDINKALAKSHKAGGHPAYVKADHLQELLDWQFASVMTADGDQLLAGHHGVGAGARMYRYNVDQTNGHLSSVGYTMLPDNAQGVADGGRVVTSGGGHLVWGAASYRIPSHAEGVALIDGALYVAFEGGGKHVVKVTR